MDKEIMVDTGSRGYIRALGGMVFLVMVALSLTGCSSGGGGGGGSGSGDAADTTSSSAGGCTLTAEQLEAIDNVNDLPPECLLQLPVPEDNLSGRIFILGTQVDQASGDLRIFAHGIDGDGNPLRLDDFLTATILIDGNPADNNLWRVEPVAAGDDVLSLGFIADYSISISNAELDAISGVYSLIVDSLTPPNLPQIMEGEVINFSSKVELKQDWTEDAALLHAAYQRDNSLVQERTALYDALGFSLQRDLALDNDGLVERCRPAHMLVVFTDGANNASFKYTKDTLLPIINNSKTVMIMLGGLHADKDELVELSGDQGAFIYAYNLDNIEKKVRDWAGSLSHMVKFIMDPATGFDAGISIKLGDETIVVERPVDGFCESPPVI